MLSSWCLVNGASFVVVSSVVYAGTFLINGKMQDNLRNYK